jgi:HAD superfamily hydrolase (TIGR01549 family)
MAAVLFDLDDTLIDTGPIRALRDIRDWRGCVASAGQTVVYAGIPELLAELQARGVRIGIVTTSISFYAERMLRHHGLPYDTLVAYHDAPPKPSPVCMRVAMQRLGVDAGACIGVGDSAKDAAALRGAGVVAYGAGWSLLTLRTAPWQEILEQPSELLARLPPPIAP